MRWTVDSALLLLIVLVITQCETIVVDKQQTSMSDQIRHDSNSNIQVPEQVLKLQQALVKNMERSTIKQLVANKQQYMGDVKLYHTIPSLFVVGQAFTIQGQVILSKLQSHLQSHNNSKTYQLKVVLVEKQSHAQTVIFRQLPATQTKFTQQIYFHKPMQFYMGILLGNNAMISTKLYKADYLSNILQITQLSQSQSHSQSHQYQNQHQHQYLPTPRIKPIGVKVDVRQNQMHIGWVPQTKLTKIRIYQQKEGQPTQQKQIVVSNDMGYLKIPYFQFSQFGQGQTVLEISHAHSSKIEQAYRNSNYCKSAKKIINISNHHFMTLRDDLIELSTNLTTLKLSQGDELTIEGVTRQPLMEYAIVLCPNQTFIQLELAANTKQNEYIQPTSAFKLHIALDTQGVYIVQINHKAGYAVLNIPVYVGQSYPLIPDPVQFTQSLYQIQSTSSSLTNYIQQDHVNIQLKMINQIRTHFGSQQVSLAQDLSKIAQIHCKDMIKRNYVSHTNPQNQSVKDRATKMGVYLKVGQNIATDKNIVVLQHKLNRSPLHLRNTINQLWTKVGIAVHKNQNGQYYAVQVFSTNQVPRLQENQVKIIKQSIIETYVSYTKQQVEQNQQLSTQLQKWQQMYSAQNIGNLKSILNSFNIKSVVFISADLAKGINYTQSLIQHNYIKPYGKKKIGLTLRQEKALLKLICIFY